MTHGETASFNAANAQHPSAALRFCCAEFFMMLSDRAKNHCPYA
jgi:hypothetical protein